MLFSFFYIIIFINKKRTFSYINSNIAYLKEDCNENFSCRGRTAFAKDDL